MNNARTLGLIAAGGSLAMLLAAWGFQYLGGLAPCAMCIWQRWPHVLAAACGAVSVVVPLSVIYLLGAASAATTSGIGVYHTGVERGWWEGPTTCTSGPIDDLSPEELLDQILGAPLVRCDEVPWELLGLSMASWNALVSAGFVLIWLAAFRAARA
ncbi:MAG: disulfide bond formation protein B [Rhodobacteraceae bacterium]|nr:disulfide bond formation protein B [Paracoccaceae bacterium]